MMKKTFRKSLALLLSLMMVVSVFSAGAFTADAITTRVMLNNCDSAEGWEPYPALSAPLRAADLPRADQSQVLTLPESSPSPSTLQPTRPRLLPAPQT